MFQKPTVQKIMFLKWIHRKTKQSKSTWLLVKSARLKFQSELLEFELRTRLCQLHRLDTNSTPFQLQYNKCICEIFHCKKQDISKPHISMLHWVDSSLCNVWRPLRGISYASSYFHTNFNPRCLRGGFSWTHTP